ncbi:putative phage holin [Nocardia fluminea]|uniref:putative phage holin n=1 Tax=Nocardia fluminea TaxID=134984 RepID=UPI00117CDFB4|nr:hypothetical protein [Nocardia fluminea]
MGLLVLVLVPNREAVATGFLGVIAVLGWVFVGTYAYRNRWRDTDGGRVVMQLMLCLTVICTQGMLTILTDYQYPAREVIRPLLLLGIALAVLDLLLTMVRLQNLQRGERR